MEPDKSVFFDSGGRYLTQSLFLEISYSDSAIYTLKEFDHEYKGNLFPSLRRLYVEFGDPTEYEFANKYLAGWNHWKRICENKVLRRYIDEWREELELKIRAAGVRQIVSQAEGGTFQAAKWLADRGWDTRGAGRPSKAEVERETKIKAKLDEEFKGDVYRLFKDAV